MEQKEVEARDSNSEDTLRHKIKVLANTAWKDRWGNESDTLTPWLQNFEKDEQLYAMFLLSRFMYYDADSIREMLKRAYEDLVRRPIIFGIRRENNDTLVESLIEKEYEKSLKRTRFLCLGNPSESSAMLLYYFRQVNNLPIDNFISVDRLYISREVDGTWRTDLSVADIDRIIVLDDFCATGSQAKDFSDEHVAYIKHEAPSIKIEYIAIVGTTIGEKKLESLRYDIFSFISILDDSFRVFSNESRFFNDKNNYGLDKDKCKQICKKHGKRICPRNPLGYKDSELIIGFHHNTPNNTLPIFWSEFNGWTPIFKRYRKR